MSLSPLIKSCFKSYALYTVMSQLLDVQYSFFCVKCWVSSMNLDSTGCWRNYHPKIRSVTCPSMPFEDISCRPVGFSWVSPFGCDTCRKAKDEGASSSGVPIANASFSGLEFDKEPFSGIGRVWSDFSESKRLERDSSVCVGSELMLIVAAAPRTCWATSGSYKGESELKRSKARAGRLLTAHFTPIIHLPPSLPIISPFLRRALAASQGWM